MEKETGSILQRLVNEKEAAEWLGLSVKTLQKWRCNGKSGLPFIRISARAIRYRMSDLVEFTEKRLQHCTAESYKLRK